MSKVWFVTGSSKGFGREFVLAALERGDQVAATARNTDTLNDLVEKYGDAVLPLRLDVTDRGEVFAAVKKPQGWVFFLVSAKCATCRTSWKNKGFRWGSPENAWSYRA